MVLKTGNLNPLGDLYSVAPVDYSGISTINGWVAAGLFKEILVKKLGKTVFVSFYIDGTSNDTIANFTLPYALNTSLMSNNVIGGLCWQTYNAGSAADVPAAYQLSGNTVTLFKTPSHAAWTASGEKVVSGQFWYETS